MKRKPERDLPAEEVETVNFQNREPEVLTDEDDWPEAGERTADGVPGGEEEDLQGEQRAEGEECPPGGPGEGGDGAATAGEESLKPTLEEAMVQAEEYLSLAQRVQADFENFRRRNQNVRSEAFDDGARAFAATLLPVVDNLERAVGAGKESSDQALREGVEMVCRQLLEVFEKRGIRPISRLGERFDPNLEDAVLQGDPEEGKPGTVCEVFQKGYQMGDMVLRHAMVKVVPE